MAKINPVKLRPTELTRLRNSTSLGEVISERTLRRHRNRAGFAIGDDRTVNLFQYAGWLTQQYLNKESPRDYEQI